MRLRKPERQLLQYLRMILGHVNPVPDGWHYKGPFDLLLREGSWYREARAIRWKRSEPHACFRNAAMYAVEHPGCRYVEGYATAVIPVHHGWVIDAEGRVIEPTWDKPGSAYFGVVFPALAVSKGSVLFHELNLAIYKKPLDK